MDLSNFPTCLILPAAGNQFAANHNRAIWQFNAKDDNGNLKRSERAILSLATGIHQFVMSNEHISVSGDENDYYATDIVRSLLSAFNDALNYDLGRLDGGMLSEWACEIHKAVTGEDM